MLKQTKIANASDTCDYTYKMHSANMAREDAKIYNTQDKYINNKKT